MNVVIIENDNIARVGTEAILIESGKFKVSATATNGKDGLDLIKSLKPDVVIVNIDLPDICGVELISDIKKIDANIKIIVVTCNMNEEAITKVINKGVDCYYCKLGSQEQVKERLIEAVTSAAQNKSWIDPHISRIFINKPKQSDEEKVKLIEKFSQKEIKTFKLAARGMKNEDIANKLYMSVGTVRAYMHNIFVKLGVKDRINAIREGINLGIISYKDMGIGTDIAANTANESQTDSKKIKYGCID